VGKEDILREDSAEDGRDRGAEADLSSEEDGQEHYGPPERQRWSLESGGVTAPEGAWVYHPELPETGGPERSEEGTDAVEKAPSIAGEVRGVIEQYRRSQLERARRSPESHQLRVDSQRKKEP
jgi:hypothetical protein